MEDQRFYDGTTRSTQLKTATSFRNAPEMNITYPIEAVVMEAIPPTDERNVTKRGWEYNLSTTLEGLPYLNNVPVAMGFGYYGDGSEEVFQAAKRTADPSNNGAISKETQVAYEETDGDRVLVQFIQGVWTKPIITARLSHQSNTVLSTTPALENAPTRMKDTPQGRTRKTSVVNGTLIDIDQDGNIVIIPGVPVDKDLSNKEKKKLTLMKSDGTTAVLELTCVSGTWAINFGAGADQVMVLGNALATFLTTFVNTYNSHTHPVPSIAVPGAGLTADISNGSITGSATVPPNTATATPNTVTHTPSNYQSDWIKSKKAAP